MANVPIPLRTRLWIEWLAVAFFSVLAVVLLVYFNGTQRVDNILYDRLGAVARAPADRRILIAAIDEDSLKRFGKWPWDRQRHAEFLNQIARAAPKAVVMDMLLSDQSTPQADAALTNAIGRNPNVLLPVHFIVPGRNGAQIEQIDPLPAFAKAAHGTGHVNVGLDGDGVLRRIALCVSDDATKAAKPHIMEQAYRMVSGKPSPAWQTTPDCSTPLMLPFAARGSFSQISYAAIAQGEVPPAFWSNRIVLVGATAAGLGDHYPVPLADGSTLSGVEIMANFYGALSRNDFVRPIGTAKNILLSLLPLIILLIGFWRWTPRQTLFGSLTLVMVTLGGATVALWNNIWFPPGAALVGLGLVYPLWGWRRLAAISDQMGNDLAILGKEPGLGPITATSRQLPVDPVTEQSAALSDAIGQLRNLRRFVLDAITNLPDPMFVTDTRGKLILANRLALQALQDCPMGTGRGQLLDHLVHPDDHATVLASLEQEQGDELLVSFHDPERNKLYLMHRALLLTASGEERGHIHYLADISALDDARQSREQVIEILSHDMRAPQSAILALLEADSSINAELRKRIATHARRTLALADNFVGMARMGNTPFHGQDTILSDLAAEACDAMWPLAAERGIKLEVDDQSNDAFILAESDILFRALLNLIDNAIKFSPDGGIISIKIARSGPQAHPSISLSVQDQGPGVETAILPTLFSRFAYSAGGTSRVKGSGLGLSFVAIVAQRHGGSVRATNPVSGGAHFTVIFPESTDG